MYLQLVTWCKENLTLGYCRAPCRDVESNEGLNANASDSDSHAVIRLRPVDRVHGGNAAAAVLDGGDSRLPAAAELRAGLLSAIAGAVFLLFGLAAGSECTNLLLGAACAAHRVRQDSAVRGSLLPASSSSSPAPGICPNARDAPGREPETHAISCGVRTGPIFRTADVSARRQFARIRFSGSGERAGTRLRCLAGTGDGY